MRCSSIGFILFSGCFSSEPKMTISRETCVNVCPQPHPEVNSRSFASPYRFASNATDSLNHTLTETNRVKSMNFAQGFATSELVQELDSEMEIAHKKKSVN
jgi:hypothetical protein